jgi:type III restriction enzyme
MELKKYQRRVVEEAERYLGAVAQERAEGNLKHAAQDAWESLRLGPYQRRRNGIDQELPTFCIKVPTGGGKTLLATQILGSIYRTILKDRNGAGLVLWVVPSSQIYRDTLKRLRDRKDLYRVMLEHAVSRRLEVWEKHEIARLSPVRLRDCLNVLVVQLASTNRETKEQLKFFKDSGGNIVQHFPPENDFAAQKALKAATPNLDMLVDDDAAGQHLAATSVGNLVRLCRPPVILDEGHKATSKLAVETIEGFNASAVVELSATPHQGANIISRVSGQELLDEQMIKLPMNIATSGQKSWKDVLTQARDKRAALAEKAAEHFAVAGASRQIRPIVLVQVERTGNDQRDKGFVHALDVQEYLVQRLSVSSEAIRIKSAQDDGLENVDLMDPGCPVEWIITKSALQEGWDCPFAYILVSLNNTGSGRSMTQLVGRVLRQPYQEQTEFADLNECYVYCLKEKASEVARQVKAALEKEGYEGDVKGLIVDASDKAHESNQKTISIKPNFARLYTKPYKGKIYLPRFCVKEGQGKSARYQPLDYFEHLLRRVDVGKFAYRSIDWPLAEAMKEAKDRFYRISLGTGLEQESETDVDLLENDDQVKGWIAASLRFEYLSHKQLRAIVEKVHGRLLVAELEPMLKDRLAMVKFVVRDHIERFIQGEIDKQTEAAFSSLFDAHKILFYLECSECRFEIPSSVTIRSKAAFTPLTHNDGKAVQRSLFDFVESESQNEYERCVALVLDRNADVLWWYRNRVGPENFTVQGYRKNKIFPDFVVQGNANGRPHHRVMVIESKGGHLEGHPDTDYKRKVASYFDAVGARVTWQKLGAEFKDHVFRFQVLDEVQEFGRNWRDELIDLLASP